MNFERLYQINNIEDWKIAYNEEIVKLDKLYQEEERLEYELYVGKEQSPRLAEIQKIKHEFMTNEQLQAILTTWKERLKNDHVWHRRLDVFLSKMEQESIDSEAELVQLQEKLQTNLLESSFTVNENEYSLATVHSNIIDNPNRKLREQLFQQAKIVGQENEDLFRKLIRKRNKLAMDLGFSNYYQFKCSHKEIDMDTYIKEMNTLLESVAGSSTYWNKRIKEKFNWEKINYYDQYYSTFNFYQIDNETFTSGRMKEVLSDIVTSLGIDMDKLSVNIESLEIPYGGFCININPGEVKLVVNKRNSYSAFLSGIHELGHAIDGNFSSFEYPELYRFFSSIAAEGIAELFQTIIIEKDFLVKNFNISDETFSEIDELNNFTNLNMVKINYFYSLVEYELYKNPERSFQKVADECYQHVFGYEGEVFHPASEMFFIENPAFFQDYNYALAIRDMIRNKFKINSLYKEKEVFHELLVNYIEPNQLYSWHERVERLCGKPHTFADLAKTLTKIARRSVQ